MYPARTMVVLEHRGLRKATFTEIARLLVQFAVVVAILLALVLANAPRASAQSTTDHRPSFDVTSVKPCKIPSLGNTSPGRLRMGCTDLANLIEVAYVQLAEGRPSLTLARDLTIEGGPSWVRTDSFEIQGTTGDQATDRYMMAGPMMQRLLEDRFKLKIHRETRELPVYELRRGNHSSRLELFHEGDCLPRTWTRPLPPTPPGKEYCKFFTMAAGLEAEDSTMTEFSNMLSRLADRPVIDKTGIVGAFNIHLRFTRDNLEAIKQGPTVVVPTVAPEPNGPNLFTAIQEQIGLKLVAAKGFSDVLVIDHVERPTDN